MPDIDIKIGNKKGKYIQENISIISSISVGMPPTAQNIPHRNTVVTAHIAL